MQLKAAFKRLGAVLGGVLSPSTFVEVAAQLIQAVCGQITGGCWQWADNSGAEVAGWAAGMWAGATCPCHDPCLTRRQPLARWRDVTTGLMLSCDDPLCASCLPAAWLLRPLLPPHPSATGAGLPGTALIAVV